MAKEEVKKDQEKEQKDEKASSGGGFNLITWIILLAVVIAGSTGGFALSQLIGGQPPVLPENEQAKPEEEPTIDDILKAEQEGDTPWLYETLEPVLANLDEPGVTRYVRVTVTLEMSPALDKEKGMAFMADKNMLLRDWMTTYFAGLSLEDVRGSRNLTRIKKEVEDQFNEILFPSSQPYVQKVLFKEFAVQ